MNNVGGLGLEFIDIFTGVPQLVFNASGMIMIVENDHHIRLGETDSIGMIAWHHDHENGHGN